MSAADVQARVQALIDHRVASGDEVGVQVVVVEHGRVVVDAVSGSADPSQGRAVAPDTLFWAASTARAWPRPSPLCWWSGASWPTTWHPLRLPRQGLRLPARRDRPASDGPHLVVVAARSGHRPVRDRGRCPFRGARGAVGPGGPLPATGRTAAPAARAGIAGRPGAASRHPARRRLRQSSGRPHLRHPIGGHHDRPRGGPALRRPARRTGRRPTPTSPTSVRPDVHNLTFDERNDDG